MMIPNAASRIDFGIDLTLLENSSYIFLFVNISNFLLESIDLRIIIEDNICWNFPELIFLHGILHGLTIFAAISSSSDIKSTVKN